MSATPPPTEDPGALGVGIGVDASKGKPQDEHHMDYHGYSCPAEYINDYTPMEFEELVEMFEKYDVDGSQSLDGFEIQKLLHEMDMDFSLDAAVQFLKDVDEDGSGILEFKEFATFVAKVKSGNPKFAKFNKLSSDLNATPVALLEDQGAQRGFKVGFELVEEREETSMHPKFFVMESHLTGTWHELDKQGQPTIYKGLKRFQGIGHTTREAKFKSVNAALAKLRALMPGLKCKPGEIPEEWFTWTIDNMLRGVDVHTLLKSLAIKGFQANKHLVLMHRVMAYTSFHRMQTKYPDLYPDSSHLHPNASSLNPACLPEEWQQWIDESLRDGIDGSALVDVLRDHSIELKHGLMRNDDGTRLGDKHLLQSMLRNESGAVADPLRPVLRDFFIATATGAFEDVRLYVSAGVQTDILEPGRTSSLARTGLMLAAANGHVDVCDYIVREGKANVDQADNTGRTALHHAAKAMQHETVQILLDHGANMHLRDNYGNTAFHSAARSGSQECVEVLASQEEENLRQVLSGKVFISKSGLELMGRPKQNVVGDVEVLFNQMIAEKMKRSEAQRFMKDWTFEATERIYAMVKTEELKMIGPPTKAIVSFVLDRFDPDPDNGFWVGKKGDERWVKTVQEPKHLIEILSYVFKHCLVDAINKLGRTALHEACFENRCGSHANGIRVMVDLHRCNTVATDMHSRTAYQLLLTERNRLGEPSGTALRESVITDRRQELVESLRSEEIQKEKEKTEKRLADLLEESCKRGLDLDAESWGMMREISEPTREYADWIEMEDGDTRNLFYVKKIIDEEEQLKLLTQQNASSEQNPPSPEKQQEDEKKSEDAALALEQEEQKKIRERRLMMKAPVLQDEKDEASAATWDRPDDFNIKAKMREGWSCILQHSTFERRHGDWDVMADKHSGEAFYKNGSTDLCQWNKPREAEWEHLMEHSTVQLQLGLHNEWDERVDPDGNVFYYRDSKRLLHHLNELKRFVNVFFWHRELEKEVAKKKKAPAPKFAEDDDEAKEKEKEAVGPANPVVEFKKPGDEALDELPPDLKAAWLLPKYRFDKPPEAVNKMFTKEKMDKMRKSQKMKFLQDIKNKKEEADAAFELQVTNDRENPVQLAYVPRKWPDGRYKNNQGWALCRMVTRIPAVQGWQVVIDPEVHRFVPVGSTVMADKAGCHGMFKATVTRQVTPLYYDLVYERDPVEESKEKADYEKAKKLALLQGKKKPPLPPKFMQPTAKCVWRGTIEPEGKEFYAHAESGAASWFPPREVKAVQEGKEVTEKDADVLFYPWPAMSSAEWNLKRHPANSAVKRILAGYEEYVDRETSEMFYLSIEMQKKEDAILLLQRFAKQRYFFSIPERWETQAYEWQKPPAVAKAERERQGWAVLRRRSTIERLVKDAKDLEWHQYADGITGERYFYCEKTGDSQWEPPDIPNHKLLEKRKNAQKDLKEGDKVYFRFPGLKTEKLCVVTKVRMDEDTLEFCYDIAVCSVENPLAPIKKMIPSTKKEDVMKWQPRGLLRSAPKTAEEVRIEIEMEAWTMQLKRSAMRDSRVEERLRVQEAEEARMKRRGGRKKAEKKSLSAEEVAAARKRRVDAEKAIRDEEERKKKEELQNLAVLAAAAKAGASVAAVEAQKNGGGVSGAAAKAGALDAEAAARMKKAKDAADAAFNSRKGTLAAREAREKKFEQYLSSQEDKVTTPRTQSRRRVLRIVHRAMLRQAENFVICEWGCGEWVKIGQPQHFHENEKCRKRIIPCSLGCPLKHTEEDWMELMEGMNITVVQHHEEVACPRRLVPCSRRCGEWVAFSDLDVHLKDLCVKRPFPELYCRLGCGLTFSGGAHRMLQCEEERLEHENEICEVRLCRCSWKGCVGLVRAKDRKKHRRKHIRSTGICVYPQPGVYVYEVPEKTFQIKVSMWGGGGGSGHILKYDSGNGGGGGMVEALVNVVPREKLELCVGSGGKMGVYGTTVEVTSWDGSEVNLEDRFGTAQGGVPGGGEGHGGNKIWACGGGGGYSIVQRRGQLGLEPILVSSGGGGGGSRHGVPGGGEDGELGNTKIDIRNGRMGRSWCGGGGGDSGDVMGCKFPPQGGTPWKGGNGGEYGGGGGAGFFGGGGGGTSPGIVGGGGGGSCYVNWEVVADAVVVQGEGDMPGGFGRENIHIPMATGVGEWDMVGGVCGEGGKGDEKALDDGKCGAIIIYRPGFFHENPL